MVRFRVQRNNCDCSCCLANQVCFVAWTFSGAQKGGISCEEVKTFKEQVCQLADRSSLKQPKQARSHSAIIPVADQLSRNADAEHTKMHGPGVVVTNIRTRSMLLTPESAVSLENTMQVKRPGLSTPSLSFVITLH